MSEAIFTKLDIEVFKRDYNKYNLTMEQLLPVVLDHVTRKGKSMSIKDYNIDKTIDKIQKFKNAPALFKYMENKLKKYEEVKNGRNL